MSYHKIPDDPYPPPGYPSVPPPPPYEGYSPPPPYEGHHQYPPPPYEGYQGYFGQGHPPQQQVQYQDQSDPSCTSFLHGCLAALCCCCMIEECCFCLR